jgi:hypothetical protein
LEGVEDTDFDDVAEDDNDNNVGNSGEDYENTEDVEGVEDTELENIVVDDRVEPSANVPGHVDEPRSALDENQQDHLINTRLPKPSMK